MVSSDAAFVELSKMNVSEKNHLLRFKIKRKTLNVEEKQLLKKNELG